MSHPTIRVRAVRGHVPMVDAEGIPYPGRYAGRDPFAGHAAIPEGAEVPDTTYFRRAITDGSLSLVEEFAAQENV